MNSMDDFLKLVRNGLGLAVDNSHVEDDLDTIPGWDSVHLIWLVTALERRVGRSVPMAAVLEATSLRQIYDLATTS